MPLTKYAQKRARVVAKRPLGRYCEDIEGHSSSSATRECTLSDIEFAQIVGYAHYGPSFLVQVTVFRSLWDRTYTSRASHLGTGDDQDRRPGMKNSTFASRTRNLRKLGEKIRAQVVQQTSVFGDPESYCKTVHSMLALGGDVEVLGFFGSGVNSVVVRARRNGQTVAIKLVKAGLADTRYEALFQDAFHSKGIAPPVMTVVKLNGCNNLFAIVMGTIHETLHQRLCRVGDDQSAIQQVADELVGLMETARDAGLTHGDMHTDNVVFMEGPGGSTVMGLIDFSFSSAISVPFVDAEQMLRIMFSIQPTYKYGGIFARSMQKFLDDSGIDYSLTGSAGSWESVGDEYYGWLDKNYTLNMKRVDHRLPDGTYKYTPTFSGMCGCGKELNSATGKCRKKCGPGKFRDDNTGRCRKPRMVWYPRC